MIDNQNMEQANCRNCGAPLNREGDCEYCGTKRQNMARSGIMISADRITLWVDERRLGKEITGK